MRAWLITWEWMSESAEVADRIATILPPRWSPNRVSDVLEQLYALSISNVEELAAWAKSPKNNPYPAKTEDNHADVLVCGSHPWLYARKVSKLTVIRLDSGYERVSWVETDRYRMKADRSGVELAHRGQPDSVTRVVRGILSTENVWDRGSKTMRHVDRLSGPP
jgi:hypothetical protein